MKHFFVFMAACFAAISVYGQSPAVYDIDINVSLSEDGCANITERWDICWNKTEWFLVRSNLSDMVISDFSVCDENGRQFIFEDDWDIDRSLEQKAGRCGIVRKRDGCELCWGVGSAERHQFTVSYKMSNVVKSLDDYDFLHIQFVSQGINPRPDHARVCVCAEDQELLDGPALAWGFGYRGTVSFEDGAIVASTDEPFHSDSESMILLIRFDKGLFTPVSVRPGTFEEIKDKAFEGSEYRSWEEEQEDDRNAVKGILSFLVAMVAIVISLSATRKRKRNRDMFGVIKLRKIGYERDLPFDGGLMESRYVLNKCSYFNSEGNTASALILRMIKDGWLYISSDGGRKVKLSFADRGGQTPEGSAGEFYLMLKDAAGNDGILEGREFSKWSSLHTEQLNKWIERLNLEGSRLISEKGLGKGTVFTSEGQKQARRVIGFRKYLKDFTLLKERGSKEVALWQDYIIFASLYGIADKVAKELKDIDPKAFETYVGYPYATYYTLINMSESIGSSMTIAASSIQTASSVGGHGGFSSFGGGGGFSGGGFGGGGR